MTWTEVFEQFRKPWPLLTLVGTMIASVLVGAALGWDHKVEGLSTLLLTAAAVAQAIFAAWSRVAAREARRSADAANSTLRLAENTTRQQLRAYVDLDRVFLRLLNEQTPQIVLQFRNFGQTPARAMAFRVNIGVGEQEASEPVWETPQLESVSALQPGQVHEKHIRWPDLSVSDVSELAAGKIRVRMQVALSYQDVFFEPHTLEVEAISVPADWTQDSWELHTSQSLST